MNRNHHPKLKPPPRPLFSCGIFRNCTQSALSPTTPPSSASLIIPHLSPPPPATPQPPPPPSSSNPCPPAEAQQTSSSSSSSSSTSQSFTQWRFPLHHPPNQPEPEARPVDAVPHNLTEAFLAAENHFNSGARLPALRILERSLATEPSPPADGVCPPGVMAGVVAALRDPAAARQAAKVLLALLLPEPNRQAAVDAGAAAAAVEAVAASGPAGATAERALAALELLCTVAEGAEEVRGHGLASPALAGAMEGMAGRGRECAIGVMAAIYGGDRAAEAPPEVARAVVVALQGECSARGRRKGAQLLRALQESGRFHLDGGGC